MLVYQRVYKSAISTISDTLKARPKPVSLSEAAQRISVGSATSGRKVPGKSRDMSG